MSFQYKAAPTPAGPTIQLDRQEAARFSAIRLSGSGFTKNAFLNILFNGQQIYRVNVLPDGSIPKDTWIWVPDDATPGVNQVWAEEGASGTRSNVVALEVSAVSREKLTSNFDELVKQYLATIPPNDRWHGKLSSGSIRNIANAAGTVTAAILWLPTAILTLGQYQDELWPDNKYVCSWYQAEVLDFLNRLRFDPDPARRAILDGLDYGPFNSGLAETPPGSHFFVVVWPHAAALDPDLIAAGFPATWETAGIAFDPWPRQTPEIFALKSGTANWAEESIYSARWNFGPQYSYLLPRPEPKSFNYNQGDYPITGGNYYNPKGKGKLAQDYRNIVGIGGEPPKMLAVHSPVTLEFKDAEGNKAGLGLDGELYDEIPGSEILVIEKPEGGYEWYVVLPEGQIDVTITGLSEGSYQLLEKTAGLPVLEYPAVNTTQGATDRLTLDDQPNLKPLRTAVGQELLPIQKGLPGEEQAAPGAGLPALLLAAGGGLACLLVAGLGVFAGLVLLRRSRLRKASSRPQPR